MMSPRQDRYQVGGYRPPASRSSGAVVQTAPTARSALTSGAARAWTQARGEEAFSQGIAAGVLAQAAGVVWLLAQAWGS